MSAALQVLMITTQSDQQPAGIWKTELEKARNIRDGKGGANPILLPVIYEYPKDLQRDEDYWRNPAHWGVLLPNLGRSIDPAREWSGCISMHPRLATKSSEDESFASRKSIGRLVESPTTWARGIQSGVCEGACFS